MSAGARTWTTYTVRASSCTISCLRRNGINLRSPSDTSNTAGLGLVARSHTRGVGWVDRQKACVDAKEYLG